MWTTPDLFRVACLVQEIFLAVILFRDHRHDPSARASIVLLLASGGHMLVPLLTEHGGPALLAHACALLGASVPFAFWYLTKVHFDDEPRFEGRHAVLLLALVGARYTGWLVAEGTLASGETTRLLWAVMPRLLAIIIVVHALLNVYVGARSDLVLQRLRLRYGVLSVVGTYVLLELLTQALFAGRPAMARAEDVHAVAGAVLLIGISFVAFRLQPEILRPARVPPETAPSLDPALTDRLRQLLEAEHVYREEGLTVAGLAQRLGTQEHRVRQLINSQLGFKNFNGFLHHYRVREAQRALSDSAQRHRSVAEIAYEVGYASLGPFNRAFKELTGTTPTEFRASLEGRSLADSGIGQLSTGKQGDG